MTPIDRLIQSTQATEKRIVVLGDSMRDVHVHGDLLPSQDGVQKFVERRRLETPGGAAGAARQLCRWSAETILLSVGHCGDPPYHESWNAVDWSHCMMSRRMPEKHRFLDDSGRILWRHDKDHGYGADANLMESWRKTILERLYELAPDAVLISDYDKGFLTEAMIREVIGWCNEKGVPIVADAKREPKVYDGAILKFNHDYWLNHTTTGKSEVITLGAEPPGVNGRVLPKMAIGGIVCKNHVGAGDCFSATLALALAHGFSLEDAAAIAHSAGRIYVQHLHGRPPWPFEIRRDLNPVGGKVLSAFDLAALCRAAPGRICWANGCFDLLGPHHVQFLQNARRQGDLLVVGLNDDQSVRRLKGPKRPIMALPERTAMLAALDCVDWVVPFSADAPVEELSALRPHVRVCADIPDRNGAGDEYAGEVKLLPMVPQASTTAMVERIIRLQRTPSPA